MLTSVCNVTVGMYILYQNLIHKIIDKTKYKQCYQVSLEGIYLQNTSVKLTLDNNSSLDVIIPDCKDYEVVKWVAEKSFCLANEDKTIDHNIENNVSEIIYKLASNKKVKAKICTYNDIEGMIIM